MKLWHTLAGVSVRTGLELEGSVAMEDKLTLDVGRVYELASGFLPKEEGGNGATYEVCAAYPTFLLSHPRPLTRTGCLHFSYTHSAHSQCGQCRLPRVQTSIVGHSLVSFPDPMYGTHTQVQYSISPSSFPCWCPKRGCCCLHIQWTEY